MCQGYSIVFGMIPPYVDDELLDAIYSRMLYRIYRWMPHVLRGMDECGDYDLWVSDEHIQYMISCNLPWVSGSVLHVEIISDQKAANIFDANPDGSPSGTVCISIPGGWSDITDLLEQLVSIRDGFINESRKWLKNSRRAVRESRFTTLSALLNSDHSKCIEDIKCNIENVTAFDEKNRPLVRFKNADDMMYYQPFEVDVFIAHMAYRIVYDWLANGRTIDVEGYIATIAGTLPEMMPDSVFRIRKRLSVIQRDLDSLRLVLRRASPEVIDQLREYLAP
jgi:hypothetical protein